MVEQSAHIRSVRGSSPFASINRKGQLRLSFSIYKCTKEGLEPLNRRAIMDRTAGAIATRNESKPGAEAGQDVRRQPVEAAFR